MQPSEADLREALATVAPELAGLPLRINPGVVQSNPLYWQASAWLDERFVVKYAWSDVRSERRLREGRLLDRLRSLAPDLPVPVVVAAGGTPALVVLEAVPGEPLSWAWARELGRDPAALARVADGLGTFLARLHGLPVAELLDGLPVVVPTAQADTDRLRRGYPALVDSRRAALVLEWCDWVDDVLDAAAPAPPDVFVHGDLHGHNQVWDVATVTLRCVVDLEEGGAADPHFDFRYLPGNADSLDLLLAVVEAYERASGTALDLDRIMAWNALTHLGDALWRTEAGVPLPVGGDATSWVDDLERRLGAAAAQDR